MSLNNLAEFYRVQGRYAAAEPLYKRSLAIWESALGPEHPNVGASLNNLALLYKNQGRYAAAEPLYKRSLVIWEKALGPEHPSVATSLDNLAKLYLAQGRHTAAEPLLKRGLAIREKMLGPEHPNVGAALANAPARPPAAIAARFAFVPKNAASALTANRPRLMIVTGSLRKTDVVPKISGPAVSTKPTIVPIPVLLKREKFKGTIRSNT
jgi:tetratricopeptide (TPR) repeat protein